MGLIDSTSASKSLMTGHRRQECGVRRSHGRVRWPGSARAQQRQWEQFGQVLTDADGLGVELQQFHLLGVRRRAQDQADGSLFARSAFVLVQPAQLELHLANVGRLERLELEFDGNQAAQATVEEAQVEVQIVLANAHAIFAARRR